MLTEMGNIYVPKRFSQNSRHRPLNADIVHCLCGHLAQCIAVEGCEHTEIVRIALGVRRDRRQRIARNVYCNQWRRIVPTARCGTAYIYVNKWRALRARHLSIYIGEELLKGGWGEVLGGFGVNS